MSTHPVLIIEDDEAIRTALIDLLDDRGYRPVAATNGCEALAKLQGSAERPCLILLDLMMPVMDGMTFRRHQLASPELASIPVVVLSAFRDVDSHAQGLGVADFVPKPIQLDLLMTMIRKHCPCATVPAT